MELHSIIANETALAINDYLRERHIEAQSLIHVGHNNQATFDVVVLGRVLNVVVYCAAEGLILRIVDREYVQELGVAYDDPDCLDTISKFAYDLTNYWSEKIKRCTATYGPGAPVTLLNDDYDKVDATMRVGIEWL